MRLSFSLRDVIVKRDQILGSTRAQVPLFVLIILLLACWYLLSRSWGHYPSVFPDEYVHAKSARLMPLSEVVIPSYLYYAVYRITLLFESDFLTAARILNTLFYVSGCYFVFFAARKLVTVHLAAAVAIVAVFSPMSTYVNYFMPEAMYFFFFWLFIALVFNGKLIGNMKGNVLLGFVFGCLALVKPHALFILPVFPLSLIIVYGLNAQNLGRATAFIATALLMKFTTGYLVAGNDGLTLFGSLYTEHAVDVYQGSLDVMYALRSVAINALGNLFALATVTGLGLIYLLLVIPKTNENELQRLLKWMIILLLVIMVPFVSVFSTSVSMFDQNLDNRIYMRYFNFALPLVLLHALIHFDKGLEFLSRNEKIMVGGMLVLPILYTAYHFATTPFMFPYKIRITDTPELFLLQHNSLWFYITIGVSVVVIYVWMMKPNKGVRAYLSVFLPLYLLVVNLNSMKAIDNRNRHEPADDAGKTIAAKLHISDQGRLLAIGNREFDLMRLLLYTGSKDASYMVVGTNDSLHTSTIPDDVHWVVSLGNVKLIGPSSIVDDKVDYSLYKLDK